LQKKQFFVEVQILHQAFEFLFAFPSFPAASLFDRAVYNPNESISEVSYEPVSASIQSFH
jgi:hypothetical protein